MRQGLVVIDVQNEYVTGRLPIVHPLVEASLNASAQRSMQPSKRMYA